MLKLPDVKVTEAVAVPAGTGAIKVAHCRVAGVIGTEIKFSLLLPDAWNRKFLMGGGGGFVGSVQNQAQFVVNAGYATAGTDTGHTGGTTDAALGAEQPRAAAQLRLPRGAPDGRSVEGDSAQLLRRDRDARVLFGLLERRTPGADGGAALPRRLRRHRRRRAGGRFHRHRRAVHQGRARAVSRSEEPDAAASAGDAAVDRGADPRQVRRARRRERRRDGGSAAVQGGRVDAHRAERARSRRR